MNGLIQKVSSHTLFRSSLIVFAGSMTANVLAYAYHLLMGRLLGPAGYGELASLLSILYIFSVPLMVAQTVLVKFVSGFKAHGEIGQAKSLFVKAIKLFGVVSIVGFPVMLLAAPWVTSFLHLPSTFLFIMVYLLLVISLFTVATSSMLTGYQKFVWVSLMGAVSILVKLIVSVPLAAWRVPGVIVAAVIASVIVYILYFIPLRFLLPVKGKPTQLRRRDAFGFAVPTLLTQLGITSLYSTDIILVRHFLDAHTAGLYAAIAILGKIIFYASSAVPMVLFPIASERTASGTKTKNLIVSAAGAVAIISLMVTIVYFIFPNVIVHLLFGNAYTEAGSFLGLFGIFISLFSVGNIIALACLAIGKTRVWIVSAACAVAQIAGISVFHASISSILFLNIGISAVFALTSGIYYIRATHEKVQSYHTGL